MRAWFLVAIIVAATVVADSLQSFEMKRSGEVRFRSGRLRRLAAALALNRGLIISIVCMAISFFAFLSLLTQADLSFAVPATAATFVLETVIARFVLRERVDIRRWLGAALVACGVALLAV